MENKGAVFNIEKAKVMKSDTNGGPVIASGEYLFGVFRK